MLTATLRAEEKARSSFSKELHDGLGPLLSSAKMSLSALQREEQDPARQEMLSNTTYLINEAIRSIREISNNLSPHVLQDFGLERAIQNFIDKSAAMHPVQIQFSTNLGNKRYETDIEVILYRVICELINNSLKHAACQSVHGNPGIAPAVHVAYQVERVGGRCPLAIDPAVLGFMEAKIFVGVGKV